MESAPAFAHWLKRRRKALDFTQQEVAQRVGCALVTVQHIEQGALRPSRQIAHRLADVLAIPADERERFVHLARGGGAAPNLDLLIDASAAAMAPRSRLPAPLTPLIGRARDVLAVGEMLNDPAVRLLTLTGPGGVGKTRLAVQAAADSEAGFTDGVVFVDLAPIHDPTLVLPTVAQTLGVMERSGQPLVESVTTALRPKRLLLVLDNFEQVLDAAPLVADVLHAAPALKALVTSRAPLRLSGEHEFPVPPLAMPDLPTRPERASQPQYAAVALFIQRAHAVKPDFQLTRANARAVVELCARLDGLPLAIELAAARTKFFPPETLLARLQHRLQMLTGGARDLPVRQQTMRATIEWSYNLLDAAEQRLFARLAVFTGGWTVAAAEAVGTGAGDGGTDGLDELHALVDQSLVYQHMDGAGTPRFGMLETIREYGLERLQASAEATLVQRRHATYYLMLAERVNLDLQGAQQQLALDRLEQEHTNLRAALQWALHADEVETAARLLGALGLFWYMHGHLREGYAWIEHVLARCAALPPQLRARVFATAAMLADRQGERQRALALCVESLALYRAMGNTQGIAEELVRLGTFAVDEGDCGRANTYYEESIRLYSAVADRYGLARALDVFGYAVNLQGDHARAEALHQQSLAFRRALGDDWGIAYSLNSLGHVALDRGDYRQAYDRYSDSLAVRRALGDTRGVARSLANLANVSLGQGTYRQAATRNAESLTLAQQVGDQHATAVALDQLGLVLLAQGDLRHATRRLCESLALWWKFRDKRGIALCIEGVAAAAIVAGDAERAVRLWASAAALRERNHIPWAPFDRLQLEPYGRLMHGKLAPATFEAAWTAGQEMTLEQAVTDALEDAHASTTTIAEGAPGPVSGPRDSHDRSPYRPRPDNA